MEKTEWEITIDSMMIIGKFFKSNEDYVNVMKVCKIYQQFTQLYHFNPISEFELFENMETQYFYKKEDEVNKIEGMHQYVYWNAVDYEKSKNGKANEVFRIIE